MSDIQLTPIGRGSENTGSVSEPVAQQVKTGFLPTPKGITSADVEPKSQYYCKAGK